MPMVNDRTFIIARHPLSGIIPSGTATSSFSGLLNAQNMEHAMTLLNQLILLSYCGQNLMKTADLVEQTYRRILGLETSILQHVISGIQFPVFISSMCDIYFEDADDSRVAQEHHIYRNRRVFSMSKMKHYILKTRPRKTTMTMAAVRVHALMVMWRWNAYLRTFNYRYDTATATNVEMARKRVDEKGISTDDVIQFKEHLLAMVRACKDNDRHGQLKTEVISIADLMMLSIDI
ncbi:unnamed protein product [Absidia cylindrospora]